MSIAAGEVPVYTFNSDTVTYDQKSNLSLPLHLSSFCHTSRYIPKATPTKTTQTSIMKITN